MKKIFSGVLALALACSTFISVSAAATPEESVSPVITGKVAQIRNGRAVLEFTIDTEGDYGVEYDSEWSEYLGDTASGIQLIQVNLTLSDDVDSLFSAVAGAKVLGNAPTVDGKKVTYAFGVGDPTEFAQNGAVLFRLNCTLKDGSMTVDQLNEYKLVKSFDNLIVKTQVYGIDGVELGGLIHETNYRTDGNGDYTDVSGVYEYTPSEDEGDDDNTATAMADGVPVTKGVYAGMTSASTDVVAADELVKIVISNDVDTSTTLEWEAPKKLGGGKTNVLAVLLYDAADETLAGSTFTVKFLSADAVIKTFTHKVQ